ncbi:MAG TPA: ATP-binding cassette domain-containing protein [Candidatus Poseidoniales archaeon]|nr:ATP-binding cassette domain-containing protein [Candidatus Poseidoniales archaeon]
MRRYQAQNHSRRIMSGEAPLLELSSLTVKRGKSTVLDSVDLQVSSGDVIVLVGENGSGKSTLIEAAAGILNLSAGKVHHSGQLIRDSDGRRNQPPPFGLALQSGGFSQDEFVSERVATASSTSGRTANEEWVSKRLEEWGLRHRSQDRIAWLSGGMKRKVGIIAGLTPALASDEARLILLDEPSEGLDENSIQTLKSQISSLSSSGHAFVIATHDESLSDLATRRITVSNSSISEEKVENSKSDSLKVNSLPISKVDSYALKPQGKWTSTLEKRTRISAINRAVSGMIALVVIVGMLSQIEPPANNSWLALLALTPALISALVKPGYLNLLSDSRAGDWWNAQLGRPLQMSFRIENQFYVPFLLALLSIYFLFGNTPQMLIVSGGFICCTLASARIHSLESTFPRQGATLVLLLLLILIWPFLLSVDLLAMDGFSINNETLTQILAIYLMPLAIWILVPLIASE